jgi:hypothetical protein
MIQIVILTTGQQVIAKVSVIENKETQERLGYLLVDPMVVISYRDETGELRAKLVPFSTCCVNNKFEFRIENILIFGTPLPALEEHYLSLLSLLEEPVELELTEEE